jgi:hypothetical protein
MRIDQRNSGASVTPTDLAYTLDRWQARQNAANKYSVQQSSVAPSGFSKSLLVTSLSAYSLASTDVLYIRQNIEGFNVADLGWGTAAAQAITVSFWVRSSLTGTFGGAINNSAVDRSYPFSYTISAANTWEQKTITIPGDTSGTWLTDNGTGIRLVLGLGIGSTISGTANSWAAGAFYAPTGSVNVVGTNGATLHLTGVQLEVGSKASAFERRPYQQELALCQRYCFDAFGSSKGGNYAKLGTGGQVRNSTTSDINVIAPVPMRIAPSSLDFSGNVALIFNGTSFVTPSALVIDSPASNNSVISLRCTHPSGPTVGAYVFIEAANTLAVKAIISAEL